MTIPSLPLPRIGDAERDDAVRLLQEHLTAGRLDHDEFADRMNTALSARTLADLDPLFVDLPGRRPGQHSAPVKAATSVPPHPSVPAHTRAEPLAHRRTGMFLIVVAVALASVLGLFAFGWQQSWLLVMIPVLIFCGGRRHLA